ncbi:hypothetical protein PQX77_014811 [Marasmius sp. AFHP31]|nr:hypothetical protein PQX77_014811 [Marasmius sp. AFHP31]
MQQPAASAIPTFDPGPAPGDLAQAEARRVMNNGSWGAGLPTFPVWQGHSPPQPPQQQMIYDPALMLPPPPPTPGSGQSAMLFSSGTPGAGSSNTTPSVPFSHLSLSTPPVLPSPAPTPAPFPPLMLSSKKYSKDEHIAEHNLLRTRIRELEQRLHMEITSKNLLKQSFEATAHQLKGGFEHAIDAVRSDLEKKMEGLRALGKNGRESEGCDSSSDSSSGSSVEKKPEEPEMSSKTAVSHAAIKNLTKQTFYLFLGTMNLKAKEDFPAYENSDQAFIQGSTETRQLRLNWETTAKHIDNVNKLATMASYLGCQPAPPAGPNSQFESFRRNYRGTSGRGRTASATQVLEVEGTDTPLNNTKFGNRASGKLKVRNRKRESRSIPETLKWVTEAKYSHAFEVNHMSDDEDYLENGKLVKNKYLARPPGHRSEKVRTTVFTIQLPAEARAKLQEVFDAVDSIPDPEPSNQYMERIKGQTKDQGIRKAVAFAKRGRRWMYKEQWLEENSVYNTEVYVLDNGTLWGDPTDPVEREELKNEVKEVKKEKKRKAEEGSGDGDGKKKKKKDKGKAVL